MAPLVTAPIGTQTIKEIPTPTIVSSQIPNTQTDCLNLITQTLQQTIHALATLVQNISLMTSQQTVTAQPTPGPTKTTSKSPLTKSQIIAQINNLLNHYDVGPITVLLLLRRRELTASGLLDSSPACHLCTPSIILTKSHRLSVARLPVNCRVNDEWTMLL
ncbi:hypothetical protein TNCV_1149051 [Trichonephila clavipes]|nr:hypothetical protein TNCV_1149051 [Trichonephila clavipes]